MASSMMVDASALIALHNPGDSHYPEAIALVDELSRRRPLVTTTHFVLEAHKRLRHDRRAPRAAARTLALRCLDGAWHIVPPEAVVGFDAVVRTSLESPGDLSLEDLSGALTMRALGIRDIWAWDDDFRRLGFRVVP